MDRRLSFGSLRHREIHGYSDGERKAWGQIGWSAVIRYLKSGHRRFTREPKEPMCLSRGGARTNQAAPEVTLLRHPTSATDRGWKQENRSQAQLWTNTLNPRAYDTTSREWSRSANFPSAAVRHGICCVRPPPAIATMAMTSQLLLPCRLPQILIHRVLQSLPRPATLPPCLPI